MGALLDTWASVRRPIVEPAWSDISGEKRSAASMQLPRIAVVFEGDGATVGAQMNRLGAWLVTAALACSTAGCSAYMAANQPGQKDIAVLNPGQPRAKLIAEFGQPIHTETKDGVRKDIFQWTQGYHSGVRAGRAVGHAVASVATLGLWEVVGTPVEGYMNGSQLSAEVHYDRNDIVAKVVPLKGEEEIKTGSVIPQPAR